jgi:glycosyltransferase involved in cell wall biosynthesis
MVKLSILMPVYNESRTIRAAIDRVLAVDYPCPVELIVIDDGSQDGTVEILQELTERGVRLVCHPRNRGKGAAVRSGVVHASGSHMVILDADLEYSPADIPAMLGPVLDNRADHVFGARIFGLNTRFRSFKFAMGGRALTLAANILFDSCLTDLHTCLKLVPVADFRAVRLSENGFGLDTELTARLLRAGVRPFEVPVSYDGRSVEDGKKISWRDGFQCLSILVKVRTERYPQRLPGAVHQPVVAPTPPPANTLVHEQVIPAESRLQPAQVAELASLTVSEDAGEAAVAI